MTIHPRCKLIGCTLFIGVFSHNCSSLDIKSTGEEWVEKAKSIEVGMSRSDVESILETPGANVAGIRTLISYVHKFPNTDRVMILNISYDSSEKGDTSSQKVISVSELVVFR